MQADLQDLIVGVLRKYPALSYFQVGILLTLPGACLHVKGYHDIMSVLYLTYVPFERRKSRSEQTSKSASIPRGTRDVVEEKEHEPSREMPTSTATQPGDRDTEDWRILRHCAEVLSLCRVRDAMGIGMQPMMGYLK